MAMARRDTTTMTMVMDVYDNDDNTASCEAAARQEAEAGPSLCNNQKLRGENGRKLAIMTPGTVTPPSTMTTTMTTSTMVTADDAAFDDDDNNVDDATGVSDEGDGSRMDTGIA